MHPAEEFLLHCFVSPPAGWVGGPIAPWPDWKAGPSSLRGGGRGVDPLGDNAAIPWGACECCNFLVKQLIVLFSH